MGSITRGIANNILGSGAVDATDGLSGTIPANNIANASLDNLTAFPPSVSAGIPSVASDPPSPTVGDVWYNTTSYKLKVRGYSVPAGTWASGGSLPAGRAEGTAFGTQTANLLVGGLAPGRTDSTLEYDGSTWTSGGTLLTPTSEAGGFGTQTAGIVHGGYKGTPPVSPTNTVVSYNGTSWSPVGNLNTARSGSAGGAGTQTAGLAFGGYDSGTNTADTETWNGTSWTEVNNLNTARRGGVRSSGNSTDVIAATGYATLGTASAELWDGTSWTNVTSVNTARHGVGSGVNGISTSALIYGGDANPPYVASTELWNGSSWTELSDLATARNWGGSGGNSSAALFSGGTNGSQQSIVEEWTAPTANQNVTLT